MFRTCLAVTAGLLTAAAGRAADDGYATLKGRVVLPNPPAPRPVTVTVDKQFCTQNGPVVSEDLIVNPANNGVKYVVVWLRLDNEDRKKLRDPFPADKIHPKLKDAPPVTRVVDQPCCQFEPRVVAARAGDRLEVRNSAKVNHNINLTSEDVSFNVTVQPGQKYEPAQPLTAQRSPVPFKCDIHPWMAGRLRVFDHPYFAVTDADGNFTIENAPVGDWRLVVWHENGFHKGRDGIYGQKVSVKGPATELDPISLELPK